MSFHKVADHNHFFRVRHTDRNSDKGEVGGSSPPRPTIDPRVRPGDIGEKL